MNKDKLNLIKEEVYKCSKCGLCQSVCPLYIATKNEMYLPRGRYIVLNNFFNNKKKLNSEFIKNLDICLNCNECKNFCPSSIDAFEIYTELKHLYNYKYGIFPFYVYYFANLYIHKIKSFFKKDKIYNITVKKRKCLIKNNPKGNVVYFQGCFNKYINPSDKNASLNIIEELGYNIININSMCCGLPWLSDGNIEHFNINSEKIIKSIPANTDYIVCSCDSCFNTLKKVFENNPLYDKLIRLDNLLKINNFEIQIKPNTFVHKTLGRNEKYYIPNEIKQINKNGSCSLMENYFLLRHKKLSKTLIKTVFYKKEDIDNKTIITTCQLSKWGLELGTNTINSNADIMSYAEYIEIFSKK